MNNKNLLIVIIFIVVIFNSIVYSALNSEMFINGDAHIRVDKDIRITNIKVLEQTNGSYETYNSDYSKNTTSMQVTLPSSDSVMVYEVTITNKGTTDYEVTKIIEESYSNSNIKYELIDIEKGIVIDGETTHTFKIKFTTTENNLDNKTSLVLKYNFKESIPTLYNMVAHESRSLDKDIDFGVVPTKETSGVYEMDSTKDSEYPVYYYRGIVDNNNVSFAGFCWKIVRTTETGGVKLIYNGIIGSDGSCNNTGEASQIGKGVFNANYTTKDDASYVYDTMNNSEIKKAIDKWYFENLIKYTNMLEDEIWCNDRSIGLIAGNEIYFSASQRNVTKDEPSIICLDNNDKLSVANGKLKYPIASLTTDELTLAGHGWRGYNSLGYLNTGDIWWTITPYALDNSLLAVSGMSNVGRLDANPSITTIRGYRPTISLINETIIKEGDGSTSNPYKLIEEKIQTKWSFDYTGSEQEFKVPYDGEYKIELWGGGNSNPTSNKIAYGGYTSGNIELKHNDTLYVYVGQNGYAGGIIYNGVNSETASNGGGGATDIRLTNGNWDSFDSLKSRIMVAAGGGGAGWSADGGSAGGLIGYATTRYYVSQGSNYMGKGATQTSGGLGGNNNPTLNGSFGIGGTIDLGSFGAGGYYGGGGGYGIVGTDHGSGGGGSSFISGHDGCDAIKEESTSDNIIHTGQSIHYSNYKFTNTLMIDGKGYTWTNVKGPYTGMSSHDGKTTMVGNNGNGYAKITLIAKK